MNVHPLALFDNQSHFHKPKSPYAKGLSRESSDYLQAQGFLYRYRNVNESYKAYRRELERFLHWCWLVKGTTLPLITASDVHHFVEFCQSPPASWCNTNKGVPRFLTIGGKRRPNPEWRPFMLKPNGELLSNKSVTELYRTLMRFFDYCAIDRYVSTNPAKQAWREAKSIFMKDAVPLSSPSIRHDIWQQVLATINWVAAESPHVYERTFFIMHLIAGLYLKISDLVATEEHKLTMGNFYQDEGMVWLFKIDFPGRATRSIKVNDALLSALKRYRIYLRLTPLPEPNEETFLLPKQRGDGPIADASSIRKMIKHAFELTAQKLKENGFEELAQEIKMTKASWLRNMAINSAMTTKRPQHIQQEVGFRSLGSLERYQCSPQID